MPRELSIGTMIGEYRIKKVLGQGGFGITYLARDENLARDVAIKEYFPKEFAHRDVGQTVVPNQDEQDRADFDWGMNHFVEEARSLTRFKHKNIVGAIRFIRENGTAYLVMEYCDGESLEALAKMNGPLPVADLMPIVSQLLDGLEEVHRARLLHLDIKPSNVFMKKDGTVVLLDFGSARQAISSHTKSVKVASAGYGAIEQESADIDSGKLGPWTDVYGFGATTYRLMTGNRPQQATARLLQDTMPALGSHLESGEGSGLVKAVTAALRVKPQDRPQSILEVRELLNAPKPTAPVTVDVSKSNWNQPQPEGLLSPRNEILGALGIFIFFFLLFLQLGSNSDYSSPAPVELPNDVGDGAEDVIAIVRERFPGGVTRCPAPTEVWTDCYGRYTNEGGAVYLGMWKLDKVHGPGQLTFPSNDRYVGQFQENEFHGQGVKFFDDGSRFEGNFRNGERHGAGVEYSAGGVVVRRGTWRDGVFVEQEAQRRNPAPPVTTQQALDLYIDVTNNTGYLISYLYVRPAGASARGPDRLGAGTVLEPGRSVRVNLPQSTVEYFDVIACDIDNDEYVVSRVNAVTSDAPIGLSYWTFRKC